MNTAFIPLSIPNISGNELEYITRAVKSQWVSTAGGSILEFEEKFSTYLHTKGSCACQSGTAGLHLCLHHFGIGKDDLVLVPTLTFIATINAIMYQSASPVFFDCDENLCINVDQLKHYLEKECNFDGIILRENKSGKIVKAIIPVHIFGDTCDMDAIMDLASTYHLIVIEDATESLGSKMSSGRYAGQFTGTIGHAGVFSFNGNKIITTGGGGMVVTNDENALKHIKYLSQQSKNDTVYFIHDEVGFNYRMTNLQAALGLGQLEQLDAFIKVKKKNFNRYKEFFSSCSFASILPFRSGNSSNHWFYSMILNKSDIQLRDKIIGYLSKHNIQVRPIWKLNHTQKPFQSFRALDCSLAQDFYSRIINLPCSTNLTDEQIKIVCKKLIDSKIGD